MGFSWLMLLTDYLLIRAQMEIDSILAAGYLPYGTYQEQASQQIRRCNLFKKKKWKLKIVTPIV